MKKKNKFEFPERARQLIGFESLMFSGNRRPSDIDGIMDFGGKYFVIFELKYKNTPLPKGQEILMENFCLAMGVPAIAILASHDVDDVDEVVDAGAATVVKHFYNGRWVRAREQRTLEIFVRSFVKQQDTALHEIFKAERAGLGLHI